MRMYSAHGEKLGPRAGYSTINDGSKDVTTAGTRVALSTSTPCKKVVAVAKATNTGVIWIGGATIAAGRGEPLVAYQKTEIEISNLASVYIDSTVNGEGVTFTYFN